MMAAAAQLLAQYPSAETFHQSGSRSERRLSRSEALFQSQAACRNALSSTVCLVPVRFGPSFQAAQPVLGVKSAEDRRSISQARSGALGPGQPKRFDIFVQLCYYVMQELSITVLMYL